MLLACPHTLGKTTPFTHPTRKLNIPFSNRYIFLLNIFLLYQNGLFLGIYLNFESKSFVVNYYYYIFLQNFHFKRPLNSADIRIQVLIHVRSVYM